MPNKHTYVYLLPYPPRNQPDPSSILAPSCRSSPDKSPYFITIENATPHPTQYRSSVSHAVKGYDEMTDDEKRLADQIIDLLGARNLSNETADDTTRRHFWASVFRNDWNTNEPNEHPGPLPSRRFTDAGIHVGTFSQDLPPSKEVLKKAAKNNNSVPQVAAPRRHGAPAYLKPSINWDCEGIVWMYSDAKGQAANPKYITLKSGYTHSQARARAIIHWDECECARIGRWNYLVGVYHARNRLLRWMQDHPRAPKVGVTNNADQGRPTAEIPVDERLDDLVQIRTGGTMLANLAQVAGDIHTMTGGRVGGIHALSKRL